MGKVDSSSAFVVGGGRGLGRATALTIAREGADVVVAARIKLEIDEVSDEIRKLGRRYKAVRADATDATQVEEMVEEALGFLGGIDVLVNCQGTG